MSDLSPPTLFLDAALIVAVLFSQNADSPGRGLFKLGENRLVDLYTSDDALAEANGVLQGLLDDNYDAIKILLAENLVMANIATTPPPSEYTVHTCVSLTKYRPDAKVLAAAVERDCEVLVTYDRQHLLNNPQIGPPNTRLVVMSGGEALSWATDQIIVRARLRMEEHRRKR